MHDRDIGCRVVCPGADATSEDEDDAARPPGRTDVY
jgi:hypothetical protein